MIRRLWVKNFGPFENATVDLEPFTVVLGRNGAGKSLLFWAIRSIGRVARFSLRPPPHRAHGIAGGFPTRIGSVEFSDIVHRRDPNRIVTLGVDFETADGKGRYEVHLARRNPFPNPAIVEEHLLWTAASGDVLTVEATRARATCSIPGIDIDVPRLDSAPYIMFRNERTAAIGKAIQEALWNRTGIYRFDPSALKSPSVVGSRFSTTGNGFAAYLDYIRNEPGGQQAFERLVDAVREICPHLKDVLLPIEATDEGSDRAVPRKRLAFVMSEPAESIPVELESDGTVLLLAYAALLHGPRDLDTLCIEEPENGIHPKAVPHQVKLLKQLCQQVGERRGVQVLVSTHSRAFFDQITEYGQLRLVRRGGDGRSSVEAPAARVHPSLAGWAGLEP